MITLTSNSVYDYVKKWLNALAECCIKRYRIVETPKILNHSTPSLDTLNT